MNQAATSRATIERESDFSLGMPIDALPNDVDALRVLVSQLAGERDVAIAESRRLTEENDQLRHLLKQLQRAQFGQRSERLDRDQMQLALEDIETSLADRDDEEEEQQNSTGRQAGGRAQQATDQSWRAAGAFSPRSCHDRTREHDLPLLPGSDACHRGRQLATS